MKKRLTLLLLISINISYICFSQVQDGNSKKAETVHIAYLTKELSLTPDEAQKFWPVYNNYKQEIKSARKGNESDQIELEEKVLNIRKKYKNDFKTVLGSDERVNKLFLSEKNFTSMLRKELLDRRNSSEGSQPR